MLKLKSKSKTLNLLALFCLGLTLATTHAQRFVKVVNTVEDLVRLNPNDVHTNVFVADPNRGGLFVLNTRATTNQGTAFMSTNATKQWNRQFSGPIDIRWFGASEASADNSTAIQAALNIAQDRSLFIPKASFTADALAGTNVSIIAEPGAVLKHKANATADLLTITVTSGEPKIEGLIFDGSMASQNAAASNWWSCLRVSITSDKASATVVGNTCTNYVFAGVRGYDVAGTLNIIRNKFVNGREHGGVLGLQSSGVIVTSPTLADAYGTINIQDNFFWQDTIPDVYTKAPGGAIIAGSKSIGSKFRGTFTGNYLNWVGQTWVGNHIGGIDLYEQCYDWVVADNIFGDVFYVPAKIQNADSVIVRDNIFDGQNSTNSPGFVIWVNPQQRSEGFGDKHGFIIKDNLLKNYPTAKGIYFLNSYSTGNVSDVRITGNRVTNILTAVQVGPFGTHNGNLTITENQLFPTVGSNSGAGLQINNFHKTAIIKDNTIIAAGTNQLGITATVEIDEANFIVEGNYVETGGTGAYGFVAAGANSIYFGKNIWKATNGASAIRILSRTNASAVVWNNGTVFIEADDQVLLNNSTMNVDWTTVTNRVDTDGWFIKQKTLQSIGIGTTPGSADTPLVIRRQNNASVVGQITNDPDLGNTSAAAVWQAVSKDSSVGMAAYPSDFISSFLRDAGAVTANSTASGGLVLRTIATGSTVKVMPDTTLSMTIDSIGTAVGGSARDTSAKLDVQSTARGFLPPRMTEAQKNAIASPANGLLIYQTDGTAGLQARIAGAWVGLTASSSSSLTPSGTITAFAGSSAPTGYLLCDGAAVNRTTYAALFAVIGETWGVGDGTTTFNVPDLRGRTVIGTGTGAGLTARTLADTGGEETHVLTEAELPSIGASAPVLHNWGSSGMSVVDGEHRILVDTESESGTTFPYSGVTDFPMLTAGSDDPHNVMQPFAAVTYIIKI